MSKIDKTFSKETLCIYNSRDSSSQYGTVNNAIYQSSTILFKTFEEFNSVDNRKHFETQESAILNHQNPDYGRYGTRTTIELESLIASLNETDSCRVTSCGYSAVVCAMSAFVSVGDSMLVADNVYSQTRYACNNFFSRYGVETIFFDPMSTTQDLEKLIKPNTKLIFMESPGSLTFEVSDVPAIAKLAKQKNIVSILDNTWATAFFFNSKKHGVDVVIESCTKYMSGHSDFLMGAISYNKAHYIQIERSFKSLAPNTSPFYAYMAMRGIRTLGARLAMHKESVTFVINELKNHPKIEKIFHPMIESSDGHEFFKRDFTGYTSLFAIKFKKKYDDAQMAKFYNDLKFFGMGYSWGGYESLSIPFPKSMEAIRTSTNRTHSDKTCIRIYIGLENKQELAQDLLEGFDRLS